MNPRLKRQTRAVFLLCFILRPRSTKSGRPMMSTSVAMEKALDAMYSTLRLPQWTWSWGAVIACQNMLMGLHSSSVHMMHPTSSSPYKAIRATMALSIRWCAVANARM